MKKNKPTSNNLMFCLFASTEDIDFVIKIYQNVIKKFLKKYGQFTVINFVKNKKKYTDSKYLNFKNSGFKIYEIDKKEKFLKLISNKKVFGIDAVGKNYSILKKE